MQVSLSLLRNLLMQLLLLFLLGFCCAATVLLVHVHQYGSAALHPKAWQSIYRVERLLQHHLQRLTGGAGGAVDERHPPLLQRLMQEGPLRGIVPNYAIVPPQLLVRRLHWCLLGQAALASNPCQAPLQVALRNLLALNTSVHAGLWTCAVPCSSERHSASVAPCVSQHVDNTIAQYCIKQHSTQETALRHVTESIGFPAPALGMWAWAWEHPLVALVTATV